MRGINRPTVPVSGGRVIHEAPLQPPLLDEHLSIDVPKAGHHPIEPISGASKNWVGTVSQNRRQCNHGDVEMLGLFAGILTVVRPAPWVLGALIAG